MRGKRKIKAALAEHGRIVMDAPTPADDCECGHEELPALWHSYCCPVARASRTVRTSIKRGV